ncbi:MAG TPA: tRNA (adenosine(37)-N6)-dimethylallyltransferase MiaA, partial [Roseobacter sp.]|nr:tRNA (adenosine(37)-N6)-dimethylallyltransferase MiaA [Roseobacter sp.]
VLELSQCHAIAVHADKDWLRARIVRRFDQMLEQGALDEVAAVLETYDPTLPAHQAIGVPELVCYLKGKLTLDVARMDAIIATRQYAKRQRTWLRKNTYNWLKYSPH